MIQNNHHSTETQEHANAGNHLGDACGQQDVCQRGGAQASAVAVLMKLLTVANVSLLEQPQ